MGPALQEIRAGGIQLLVEFAEIVVDGGGPEHTDPPALALLDLEPLRLDDDTETLDEEDAAEDGQ